MDYTVRNDKITDEYLEGETLESVGKPYGISRQRTYQLVCNTLEKAVGKEYKDKLLSARKQLAQYKNKIKICPTCKEIFVSDYTYCSQDCVDIRTHDLDDQLQVLERKCREVGRPLTFQEVNGMSREEIASAGYFQKRCGSWSRALELVGWSRT